MTIKRFEFAPDWKDHEKSDGRFCLFDEVKKAFVAGYESGHNDTVESCYGDAGELADDYISEVEYEPSVYRVEARGWDIRSTVVVHDKETAHQVAGEYLWESKYYKITINDEPFIKRIK